MQQELTALLQRAQPNAVAFGGAGISSNPVRWCGTEGGNPPGYPTIWSTGTDGAGVVPSDGALWCPSGNDFTLQQGDAWFYEPGLALHPLADLIDVYHKSVGCNGKLELDFAISRTGQLDPSHVRAYAAFGAWQRDCYGTPLASTTPGTSLVSTLDLAGGAGAPVLVDRIMLREDLSKGQNVRSYVVEWDAGDGSWRPFCNATTVGNKKIHVRQEGAVNATRLRLTLPPSTFPAPYQQVLSVFAAFAPGPCAIGPKPARAVRFMLGQACLITNASTSFPCPGGAHNACPVFLGSCADPTALWDDSDGTLQNLQVAQATGQLAGINIDCDSQAAGAVAKLLGMGSGSSANPIAFSAASGGQLVYTQDAAGAPQLCLDGGSGPYSPPCGSEQRSTNQVATQPCSAAATMGWSRVPQ